MFARSLTRRFRSIAFYRDEIAIVVLGLAHQALVAGAAVPGLTVAVERDMVVRIADVHATAVHVAPGVRYEARSHAVAVPSAVTFEMPALPVPELEAMRLVPRAPLPARLPAQRYRVVTPPAPTLAPVAPTAEFNESALREQGARAKAPGDGAGSEVALRAAMDRARVEARVRAAVARALAAEQAARRYSADDVNQAV